MFRKKNLMINCDICDARNVNEEDLSGYEQILLNTDLLVTTRKSRSILDRLPVICNTDNTMETEEDASLILHNGSYVISGKNSIPSGTALAVNGALTIHSDADPSALASLSAVNVSGSLLCPESALPRLKNLYVGGEIRTFPDDCTLLDDIFTPDAYFHLRAGEGRRYYADREIRFTDPRVNISALKEKGIRFFSPVFLVPEEQAADALELFDDTARMEVIPEGLTFAGENCVLDRNLIKKHPAEQTGLYIRGNLTLNDESTALLPHISRLYVTGTVYVPEHLEEAFRKCPAEYGSLEMIKEEKRRILENSPSITLDPDILDASSDGVLVRNCAVLKLHKDISPQAILERLDIMNCARVECTEEQTAAVHAKSTNVGQAGPADPDSKPEGMLGVLLNLADTKMINAEKYIM